MDYYMHLIPGRIRIRTQTLKSAEAKLETVGTILNTIRGITSVKTVLGSLLICYDRSQISSQSILHEMIKKGLFPAIDVDPPTGIPRAHFGVQINSNLISNG